MKITMQENTASCACFTRKRTTEFKSEKLYHVERHEVLLLMNLEPVKDLMTSEHYSYQKIRKKIANQNQWTIVLPEH